MEIQQNKVSVLMPIRNGASYLKNIIESININTSSLDQIVLVNDGSTDDTDLILKNWCKEKRNITVITTKGIGIVKSLNLGLKECKNTWIARFDVDDQYSNNRIDKQLKSIGPSTVGIFADYSFIDDKGENYGPMPSPIYAEPTSVSLINSARTAHPVVIFNKDAVLEVGGYREEDFPAEDLSLWLRLNKLGELISVPEFLLEYKIRKGSITSQKRSLALRKKREVINLFGIQRSSLEFCNNNIDKILDSYNGTPCGKTRKILFLRDLAAANKQFAFSSNLNPKFVFLLMNEIAAKDGFNQLKKLSIDKKRRSKLRKSLR
jgi:glycosyltransferase involved in cell wall biosynthesis